jgi:hypothetical protein
LPSLRDCQDSHHQGELVERDGLPGPRFRLHAQFEVASPDVLDQA